MKKFIGLLIFFAFFFLAAKPALAVVTFSLEPVSGTIGVGETTQVNIVVNTGGATTGAVSVILSFDPEKLSAGTSLAPGVFSLVMVNTVDNTTGEIRYDAGPPTNQNGSNIIVATISFSGEAAGTADVSFTQTRAVNPTTEQYLETTSTGGSYTVTGEEEDASPTPASSPSPSPSPETGGAGASPSPLVMPEDLPESGILSPTFFFLASGGILLLFAFLLI